MGLFDGRVAIITGSGQGIGFELAKWMANEGCKIVTNNRKPKLRQVPSTGLGQKYLRGQYKDVAGKDVTILPTEQDYTVKIPLI